MSLLDQLEQDGIALVPETAVLPVGEGPLHPGKGVSTPSSVIWSWAAAVEVPYQPLSWVSSAGIWAGWAGVRAASLLHLDALLSQGIQKDTGGG